MKSFEEVYETWFGRKENVIVVSGDYYAKLIIGFETNSVSIALVMKILDKYKIYIDKRIDLCLVSDSENNLYLYDTQRELYKILFNLEYFIKYRDIPNKKEIDLNSVDEFISNTNKKCNMDDLKTLLKYILKNYYH